jgi:hypothetical protein
MFDTGGADMTFKDTDTRFTFFFPDARVLSDPEIDALPADKKQAADSEQREGVWLEVFCPDASCVSDDGRITIPAVGTESGENKGMWLNIFCPEGSCELNQISDLP